MDDITSGAKETLLARQPIWPGLGNGPHWPTGPYWPYPPFSAGDIHGIFVDRFLKTSSTGKKDSASTVQTSLMNLASMGLLKREEIDALNKAVDLFRTVEEGRQLLGSFRRLHSDLLVSGNGGPISLAIISIGIDSVGNYVAQGNSQGRGVAEKDVKSGLEGAAIGASVGGLHGAIIGALIGAVCGSVAAAIDARLAEASLKE